jgi:hypothetical protein
VNQNKPFLFLSELAHVFAIVTQMACYSDQTCHSDITVVGWEVVALEAGSH